MDELRLVFETFCIMLGTKPARHLYEVGFLWLDKRYDGWTVLRILNRNGGVERLTPRMPEEALIQYLKQANHLLELAFISREDKRHGNRA